MIHAASSIRRKLHKMRKPILNASLPPQFRQIRIALAREPTHPEGDVAVAHLIVAPFNADDNLDSGFFDVQANNDTNRVDLFVFGNEERFVTVARLDNLGKGASGAAIQCMNLAVGADEASGLKR